LTDLTHYFFRDQVVGPDFVARYETLLASPSSPARHVLPRYAETHNLAEVRAGIDLGLDGESNASHDALLRSARRALAPGGLVGPAPFGTLPGSHPARRAMLYLQGLMESESILTQVARSQGASSSHHLRERLFDSGVLEGSPFVFMASMARPAEAFGHGAAAAGHLDIGLYAHHVPELRDHASSGFIATSKSPTIAIAQARALSQAALDGGMANLYVIDRGRDFVDLNRHIERVWGDDLFDQHQVLFRHQIPAHQYLLAIPVHSSGTFDHPVVANPFFRW
jgi:hypothetical protein